MFKQSLRSRLAPLFATAIPLFYHLASAVAQESQPLSPAEKIYAELANLPQEERQKRLEEGARKEGQLVVVDAMNGEEVAAHGAMFRKRYPFIDLQMTNLGSQDAADRLLAEETAGRHLTDALDASLPDLRSLLNGNYLARYPTPVTAAILPQYRDFLDPQNRWVPWFWSEHGISYNTNLVPSDKAPKDWFDLCNPFFKGNVSFDPAEVRYLTGLYTMLGEAQTEALLKCMGENDPIIQRGHLQRLQLMLAGDHMVQGDNYLYNGLAIQRKNPSTPYAIVYSAPVLGYGAAVEINRNTTHPYAAALFADFGLSRESQDWIASLLRGPLAVKHPYLPPETKIITYADADPDLVQRLLGYWRKYMEKRG